MFGSRNSAVRTRHMMPCQALRLQDIHSLAVVLESTLACRGSKKRETNLVTEMLTNP